MNTIIPLNADGSLAQWEALRKVSIRSSEIKDWLNTSLERQRQISSDMMSIQDFQMFSVCLNKLQVRKETYTLSLSSSAILRISNSSTIFPECSMIEASSSDSMLLYQPSSSPLWAFELMAVFSPTQRRNNKSVSTTELKTSWSHTWSFNTFHCRSAFRCSSTHHCTVVGVVSWSVFDLLLSTAPGKWRRKCKCLS